MKEVLMTSEQFTQRQEAFKDFGWTIDSPTQRSMMADDYFRATTDHAFTTKLYGDDRWWLLGRGAK